MLGRALFFPGLYSRREALTVAGGKATALLLGSIPLLLIAGTIEGFFSPTDAPVAMKFALSAILGSCLIVWLSTDGTKTAQDRKTVDAKSTRADSGL